MKKTFLILINILSLNLILFSSRNIKVYYEASGSVVYGFKIIGKALQAKPLTNIYAMSFEDSLGRKSKLEFYSGNNLLERKLFNDEENVTYIEGLSNFKRAAWFEAHYTYRSERDNLKEFVKEIDYRIFKSVLKRQNEVLHREITKFETVTSQGKIWNIMHRRDFLPNNQLRYYWIFKYRSIEETEPYEIHEFDVNNKLKRIGNYEIRDNKQILIFRKP